MNRQALIDAIVEATIDYVMTQVKGGRSVGPAWVRQQEREVTESSLSRELLAKIKKPKKPKPWDKHVRSRQGLEDKIVKKVIAKRGKARAIFTKLPSQVASEKGTPLGTYLAKHSAHRDLVSKARGKSRLPK